MWTWPFQSLLQTSDLIEARGGGDEINERKAQKVINRPRKLEGSKLCGWGAVNFRRDLGMLMCSTQHPFLPSFLLTKLQLYSGVHPPHMHGLQGTVISPLAWRWVWLDSANHRSTMPLASDWFRHDRVTQLWPQRHEGKSAAKASGKAFLLDRIPQKSYFFSSSRCYCHWIWLQNCCSYIMTMGEGDTLKEHLGDRRDERIWTLNDFPKPQNHSALVLPILEVLSMWDKFFHVWRHLELGFLGRGTY